MHIMPPHRLVDVFTENAMNNQMNSKSDVEKACLSMKSFVDE
jgi:hypothetical protein